MATPSGSHTGNGSSADGSPAPLRIVVWPTLRDGLDVVPGADDAHLVAVEPGQPADALLVDLDGLAAARQAADADAAAPLVAAWVQPLTPETFAAAVADGADDVFSSDTACTTQHLAVLLRHALARRRLVGPRPPGDAELGPWHRIFDDVPAMVFVTNERGETLRISRAWSTFSGTPLEAAEGFDWVPFVHPDDRDPLLELWQRRVDEQQPFEGEFRLRAAGGDYRPVYTRAVPWRHADGSFGGQIGVCMDMSRQREAEQRRSTLVDSLRAMASMTQALMSAADEDAFWRLVVEQARARLGVERCGVFVLEGGEVRGTYGTDLDGRTVAEHELRFDPADWSLDQPPPAGSAPRWGVRLTLDGWRAWTVIATPSTRYGVLCSDSAITSTPFDSESQEVVSVYASLVAQVLGRRRQDEQMRQEHALLSTIMETSAAGITLTAPDGTLVYANSNARALFLFDDLVAGRTLWSHARLRPLSLEGCPLCVEELPVGRALAQREPVVDQRLVGERPDGERIYLSVTSTPLLADDGELTGVVCVTTDITARVHAEEALVRSEEQLRTVLECIDDIVSIVDSEAVFLYHSPAMKRVLGYDPDELVGIDSRTVVHPDDVPMLDSTFGAALVNGTPSGPVTWRARHKDGSYRRLEGLISFPDPSTGFPGMVVTTRDVTQRHEQQNALKESEERLRLIVDAIGDIVAMVDADGTFRFLNETARRVTGHEPEALLGTVCFDLVHPDDRARVVDQFMAVATGAMPPTMVEFRVRHADGAYHAHLGQATPPGDGSAFSGIIVNTRDISERRSLEEQFLQAQKMEAVGRLAAGVAHDFNNMLTAVLGYGGLLLDEFDPDDERREFAEVIVDAAQSAGNLTSQLLTFSRKQVLQPEVLDLNHLVRGLNRMLHRLIGEDVELRDALHADVGPIEADRAQMEQVVVNLVVNARDAMPTGGEIMIRTRPTTVEAGEGALEPGRYTLLEVDDTGHGMDAATIERIFEPFFTTKERGRGTGLGLATVYGIVTQSGGTITVDSTPGEGTCFRVFLPEVAEPLDEIADGDAGEAMEGGTEAILLVEDDDAVRHLVRRVLAGRGYHVVASADPRQALEIAAGMQPLDLVITDVIMPGMSGGEFVRRLRAQGITPRALFISGYTDETIARYQVLEPGAELLNKPFLAPHLLRKVREVLDG